MGAEARWHRADHLAAPPIRLIRMGGIGLLPAHQVLL